MLRREQNDTNTKIAATLVCNFKGIKMICIMSISRKLLVCINEDLNYMRYTSYDIMQLSGKNLPQQNIENALDQKIQYQCIM
jgi:hypothetical protein